MNASVIKRVALPTKELSLLLDEIGIFETWKQIILTYAVNNFSKSKAEELFHSEEFKDVQLVQNDLLKDLAFGKISILYEFSLSYVNKDARKKSGQYFTPDDVSKMLAEKSNSFDKGVWLDPCSGIGNLSYWLTKEQKNPEDFIKNNLILIDKDPLALLIARSLFFLHFHEKENNLFENLKKNFIERDFLDDEVLPEYDYAILNPPYVMVSANPKFKTSQTRDLYAYFMEKIILSSKGFISITPQGFTNGDKFSSLRKLLIGNFNQLKIYCFDNVPDSIFKGIKFGSTNTNTTNSTRAAVTVAQKSNVKNYFITPLLRWRSATRVQMLSNIDIYLTKTDLTEAIFPKNYKSLQEFYKTIKDEKWKSLLSFLSSKSTEFNLIIPSTPRYFIPSVKRSLLRSSFKTIYFKNESDLNLFYPLLNSSLLYWWWRVNDGGMTLSLSTLLSLPIPPKLQLNKELVAKIEKSEIDNLVVKLNAGKKNENVKHSLILVDEINKTYFSEEIAKKLLKIHSNSDLEINEN